MENKIYALMGPQAAGKTTMAAQLISMGIHFIPVYTTKVFVNRKRSRHSLPMEELYKTISHDEFAQQEFVVQFTHKGESYGYRKDDILNALKEHKISLLILEIPGLKPLSKLIKKKLVTIFLMVDYVTLVDRLLHMGYNNEEIKYTLQYAENNKEFDGWKVSTHVIKNTCDPQLALFQLLALMELTAPKPQEQFDELIK